MTSTSLDRFTESILNHLYPTNQIPNYVSLDIFIPIMQNYIMKKIVSTIHDNMSNNTLLLDKFIIYPFSTSTYNNSSEILPSIVIPQDVINYVLRIKNN